MRAGAGIEAADHAGENGDSPPDAEVRSVRRRPVPTAPIRSRDEAYHHRISVGCGAERPANTARGAGRRAVRSLRFGAHAQVAYRAQPAIRTEQCRTLPARTPRVVKSGGTPARRRGDTGAAQPASKRSLCPPGRVRSRPRGEASTLSGSARRRHRQRTVCPRCQAQPDRPPAAARVTACRPGEVRVVVAKHALVERLLERPTAARQCRRRVPIVRRPSPPFSLRVVVQRRRARQRSRRDRPRVVTPALPPRADATFSPRMRSSPVTMTRLIGEGLRPRCSRPRRRETALAMSRRPVPHRWKCSPRPAPR